jgi:phosphoribosylamine--glycine ligase
MTRVMGKVLIVGSGGREHAIAWRLHQEGHEVVVSPGNPGMESVARCAGVGVGDLEGLVALSKSEGVDLVVVGPEQPLVDGLADRLRAQDIPTVGPSREGAKLEGSKVEAKAFMERHGIPTARSVTVRSREELDAALASFETPPVVKADGLAAGKGVTVAETQAEARAAALDCLEAGKFGEAGASVVLEERLVGQEASFFVLTDGTHAVTFEAAQDHKRIGEGDTGPNTGGMGAYLPAPVFSESVRAATMEQIVGPTLRGLREEGRPYCGILFIGLMISPSGDPKVIEYNCRFGDPEVQPLMLGLQAELYPRLRAAAKGELTDERLPGAPAATVVLASAGYPASSHKGDAIEGLEAAAEVDGVVVFHAGTRRGPDGGFETAGGRVLGVCARADTFADALRRAYEGVDRIRFDGMQVRRDIGARALR